MLQPSGQRFGTFIWTLKYYNKMYSCVEKWHRLPNINPIKQHRPVSVTLSRINWLLHKCPLILILLLESKNINCYTFRNKANTKPYQSENCFIWYSFERRFSPMLQSSFTCHRVMFYQMLWKKATPKSSHKPREQVISAE